MERVAIVAPLTRVRQVLCAVADAGVVDLERDPGAAAGPARRALERLGRQAEQRHTMAPELHAQDVDVALLERTDDMTALAGEAELEEVRQNAVGDEAAAAFLGWSPVASVDILARRVAVLGGGVVRLRAPRGVQPPTFLQPSPARTFQPLVDTYATVPYRDVNPSLLVGVLYVLMFGMMFGDVGHGALLLAFGAVLRWNRSPRLARLRWTAPFVVGAGLSAMAFGFAYGDAFGPTGLVPTLWIAPVDHATTLLAVALAVGAVLLGVSYVLGTVNRWREAGAARALVALSGGAGGLLFLGLVLVAGGWVLHLGALPIAGVVIAATGLVLGFLGLFAEAGGRAAGAAQAGVELFDGIVRIGTNTVSFARLAAFGITHAALTAVVWTATIALAHRGGGMWVAAVVVFVAGNAFAFGLEGLVAAIQALRLEYYELFSRIFTAEGRRFRPWHVPVRAPKEAPCSPG
ncbi:MAG TPA: V-type ATPase 116kDa subunit family protein [Candidatus Sulfotelmatobacter sp.]|nr:V-type ATPase 116kDa subunit family protein [Candidatus Sulfotelmatobacter sp.]